ncbi:iron transport multicopper oxidase FET3 precursor [Lindgomyces ingoldianus]|uniref:Iron transport multicopper oxidase FET3 n=1 Tax=Lindgomyces ingoldianus TaxID=673940 RepID=A0ACB6QSF4_9PLEO|nr:iron transport multicopper oxidase FET3 precursor [Lindgomyces ingoldianus]KAF2469772.1 iron transport multicopper oxidase FET3 precursor [Lindgomyces ingoldianus]
MAMSLSSFLLSISFFLTAVYAATVTYDFDVSWVYANPDGVYNRPVIGVNGKWPLPPITATKGDRVVVNVKNSLGNETTSLHFHGLFQFGTNHMDGPIQVTQCPIPPGGSFTYNFTIDQPGTYWYHSHTKGQYPDGIRAPLIVHDPDSPHKDLYDEEIVISFSDWYHGMMGPLLTDFISIRNPSGAEPVPNAALVNDTQNLTVSIQPGKTYLVRMVNMGAFAAQYVWFEGHTMKIVEVDGIYTEPTEANMLYMTAAQRYSVLITAKNSTDANFAFVGSMDQDLFDVVPAGLNPNVTGWLVYDEKKEKPAAKEINAFEPFDDFTLVPEDKQGILDKVDHSVTLDMKMDNLGDGANYAFFNDVTFVRAKVPTLYTVLTSGSEATNPVIYGGNTNQILLKGNETVEIILNNNDPGKHPFHLHGHEFQVVSRSEDEAGAYISDSSMPPTPMRRDTVLVRPNGHIVLRFRATNPGVWLFHCHIEWHVASGLVATIIEDPLTLQAQLAGKIPANHLQACKDSNTPSEGNAAGNTKNLLDLTGQNKSPSPLPAGFTARGIVALVFSCLAAFIGMAVIGQYGMAPVKAKTG